MNETHKSVTHVYEMWCSGEEGRPFIDLEKHHLTWDDWGNMEAIFPPGVDVIKSPDTLNFHVDKPEATEWDWYNYDLISQRAKDILWPYAKGSLRCFETTLNGAPYYILRVDEDLAIDCLDREKSIIRRFPSSGRVMKIMQHVFHLEKIYDPLIFHISESPSVFCTQSIKQIVEDAGLRGILFRDTSRLSKGLIDC